MKGFWIDFALLHFSCSQRYAVIYQWLQRLLVLHRDLSSSRIGSKPRGCDETSLFACDEHAIFSNVPGKAGVGHVMFLACFSLPSYRDGAAVRSGEPKSVSGNSVILGTKQRTWKFPHPNVRTSLSHCLYSPGYTHLPYPTSSSWEMWIHCRCYGTWIFGVPWHPLYPLHHTFIHVYPHIHSHFIHFSDFDLSTPGDKQPTPKWAGGAGSHGPWSAANTRVTSSDLTQLDAWWWMMRIFAKTGLPNCLGSCAGCPCLSYLRAELEGSDWLTRPVESANIRSRRLWVLLSRIPLTLGIDML